jgi:DDE superfamily endonuclease
VLPYVDAAAMCLHLEEISRHVAPGAHALLVLDGAGWHGASARAVPDNLTRLPLPPCSPELNPLENIWQHLRRNQLSLRVWPDHEAIVETCCRAWNAPMRIPDQVASITRREWARAVTD